MKDTPSAPVAPGFIWSFRCLCIIAVALLLTKGACQPDSEDIFIRVNQVGFLPGDIKSATVLTTRPLTTQKAIVWDITQNIIAGEAALVPSGKPYGDFAYTYTLVFNDLQTPGSYRINVQNSIHIQMIEQDPRIVAGIILD